MPVLKLRKPKVIRTARCYQGWCQVGANHCYFRSKMEVLFAQYLQFLVHHKIILKWEYEPKTFWFEKIKRGVRSYKPDFLVHLPHNRRYWVEVKGHMDRRSIVKLKRFQRFYPNEEIHVINAQWFKEARRKMPYVFKDPRTKVTEKNEGEQPR